MKKTIPLAIPFRLYGKLNDRVAEFNIRFIIGESKIENLETFAKTYPDKRINIFFEGKEDVPTATLTAIRKKFDNVFIRLSNEQSHLLPVVVSHELPFFFDASLSAINFAQLHSQIATGVSDLYIADDLCYNLSTVSQICHDNGVRLRLVLNRIPSFIPEQGYDPTSPIYRPQDIDLLSEYFDIFEFDCGMPVDMHKLEVLYRTWFERKNWHGDLQEINEDWHLTVHNDTLVPDFTSYKVNCGRKCRTKVSYPCKKCWQFLDISEMLSEKQVRFRSGKK